jgi:hypothetical protein
MMICDVCERRCETTRVTVNIDTPDVKKCVKDAKIDLCPVCLPFVSETALVIGVKTIRRAGIEVIP